MSTVNEEKSVVLKIYGQDYPVRGKVDVELLKRIASLVNDRMNEVGANMSSSAAVHKIAVLAAMNIAGEYLEYRDETENLIDHVEKRSRELILTIDRSLEQS
jgi:cell division protein ZapA